MTWTRTIRPPRPARRLESRIVAVCWALGGLAGYLVAELLKAAR